MLPLKHRINRRFFNDVFSKGQFFSGEHLSGKILLSNDDKPARLAVVVQKKGLKKAVNRNRLRRRIYAAITPFLDKIKPGFAIIIIAKPNLLTMDFGAVQTMLVNLLKHYNLIND